MTASARPAGARRLFQSVGRHLRTPPRSVRSSSCPGDSQACDPGGFLFPLRIFKECAWAQQLSGRLILSGPALPACSECGASRDVNDPHPPGRRGRHDAQVDARAHRDLCAPAHVRTHRVDASCARALPRPAARTRPPTLLSAYAHARNRGVLYTAPHSLWDGGLFFVCL